MQRPKKAIPSSDLRDLVDSVMPSLLGEKNPVRRYEALTQAQQVFESLVGRLASERARAAAEMHGAGLSYAQIAEILGFTRARAQQLVERAPERVSRNPDVSREKQATTSRRIAEYLSANVSRLLDGGATVTEVSALLFADSEFRAFQLGTLLRVPNRTMVTEAVKSVEAHLSDEQETILIDAILHTAQLQQTEGREKAMAAGLLLAIGAALLASDKK